LSGDRIRSQNLGQGERIESRSGASRVSEEHYLRFSTFAGRLPSVGARLPASRGWTRRPWQRADAWPSVGSLAGVTTLWSRFRKSRAACIGEPIGGCATRPMPPRLKRSICGRNRSPDLNNFSTPCRLADNASAGTAMAGPSLPRPPALHQLHLGRTGLIGPERRQYDLLNPRRGIMMRLMQ
jgi:hypothetical protein